MTIKLSQLVAADTPLVGDELLEVVQGGVSKQVAASALGMGGGRILLTADTTYYVATTGNDSTGDGSVGNPWLTIQKAIDWVASNIDGAGYAVTIQVADGTYAEALVLKPILAASSTTLLGNITTPANVLLDSTGNCVEGGSVGKWVIQGFKFQSTDKAINITGATDLSIGLVDFGATTGNHMVATRGASLYILDNYTISGNPNAGAGIHMVVSTGAVISGASGKVVTLSGTRDFFIFVYCRAGVIEFYGYTYSGTATGIRYYILKLGQADTNGGGANYFPGDAVGQVLQDGKYY